MSSNSDGGSWQYQQRQYRMYKVVVVLVVLVAVVVMLVILLVATVAGAVTTNPFVVVAVAVPARKEGKEDMANVHHHTTQSAFAEAQDFVHQIQHSCYKMRERCLKPLWNGCLTFLEVFARLW